MRAFELVKCYENLHLDLSETGSDLRDLSKGVTCFDISLDPGLCIYYKGYKPGLW